MATIRRNKYGRLMYATAFTGTTVTGWSVDPAAAAEIDEATARAIVDAHKARNNPAGGQLAALDVKGKTIALWGEPGEPPAPPKPVASLPGLAERMEKLEERVEMIEATGDSGGLTPFTNEEVAALKGMLGEWAAHKGREAAKDKNERNEQHARGEQKSPAASSVPAG